MAGRLLAWAAVILAVVAADQFTKWLAVGLLAGRPLTLIPGFADLVLVYNKGAAFSLLADHDHGRWILVGLNCAALGVAGWLVARGGSGRRRGMRLCISLISGGAVGNLIDRVRLGQVVDFVYLHLGDYYWPAFNLADAAISVGGVALAVLLWRQPGQARAKPKNQP